MELNSSELSTIKRALIIYNKQLYNGLKNKGFFIDRLTFEQDIINIHTLLSVID